MRDHHHDRDIGAKNIVQKFRESSPDFAVSKLLVNKNEEIRNDFMRDLHKVMSPELINRIDTSLPSTSWRRNWFVRSHHHYNLSVL